MFTAMLVAAAATFAPFYVGPPQGGLDVTHYTEYADTPAQGRAACLDDLRWAFTRADCQVVPADSAPDVTRPGWALSSGPSWAPETSTNFWGVQDATSPNWVNPWG